MYSRTLLEDLTGSPNNNLECIRTTLFVSSLYSTDNCMKKRYIWMINGIAWPRWLVQTLPGEKRSCPVYFVFLFFSPFTVSLVSDTVQEANTFLLIWMFSVSLFNEISIFLFSHRVSYTSVPFLAFIGTGDLA